MKGWAMICRKYPQRKPGTGGPGVFRSGDVRQRYHRRASLDTRVRQPTLLSTAETAQRLRDDVVVDGEGCSILASIMGLPMFALFISGCLCLRDRNGRWVSNSKLYEKDT